MNGLVKQEDLEILHNISRGQGYLFLSKYSTSIHLQQYVQLIQGGLELGCFLLARYLTASNVNVKDASCGGVVCAVPRDCILDTGEG